MLALFASMDRDESGTVVFQELRDFLLGHTIFLGGFKFQLLKADEYTEKYMEDNPDIFPQASLNAVVAKIKKGGQAFKSL